MRSWAFTFLLALGCWISPVLAERPRTNSRPNCLAEIEALKEDEIGTYRFQSERTIASALNAADENALAPILGDPEVKQFFGDFEPDKYIEIAERRANEGTGLKFLIREQRSGAPIGIIVFKNVKATKNTPPTASIGYAIHKDYRNQGYATEVGASLVRELTEKAGYHRVRARVDDRNIASQKVLEHLGFKVSNEQAPEGKHYYELIK